ncbi:adenylate cyclase [Variovorax sp. H27-G14]|uniref:MoaF-related domain-containing protein n=1 Tax=Variovorax sp. H27-G14 TaxID=3111914 RepID=UPI0038FCB04D
MATAVTASALPATASPAPALPFVGRTFEVHYGDKMTALNIYAPDGQTMRYRVTAGPFKGATAEVRYQAEALGAGLYAISWQEADKGTVVHVDHFDNGHSCSYYTTAQLDFVCMAGTLREVQGALL